VSGFNPQQGIDYPRAWIKTNTTISGGNSGGTGVDEEGLLIGVPTRAGSGAEGSLVDCRVVEDTNGDGRIDSRDSCIPIGGFLNSLRPINLAFPLIDEAITGVPSEDLDEPPTRPGSQNIEGVTIHGTIIDADTGRPLPNAYFVVLQPGVTTQQFLTERLDEQIASVALTDVNGAYQLFPPLPRGAVYSALILAEGYQPLMEDNAINIGTDAPDMVEFDPIAIPRQ
jgi:hypothetical protein